MPKSESQPEKPLSAEAAGHARNQREHARLLMRAAVLLAGVTLTALGLLTVEKAWQESQFRLLYLTELAEDVRAFIVAFGGMNGTASVGLESRAELVTRMQAAFSSIIASRDEIDLVVSERQGDGLQILTTSQRPTVSGMARIEWGAPVGEPSQRALSGESGWMLGRNYEGDWVLSVYRPIPETGWGLSAQQRLGSLLWPFVRSTLLSVASIIVLVVAGLYLLRRWTAPLFESLNAAEALLRDRNRQLEDAVAARTLELKHKNAELEQVVYIASHDLRSPLVNVQGFSQELAASLRDIEARLDDGGASPELRARLAPLLERDIPEALNYIARGIERMDALLKGLLAFSRTGRAPVNLETLDMNAEVAKSLESLRYSIEQSGAKVSLGELPPCQADRVLTGQLLGNLVENALKYRDADRPCEIAIQGERRNGRCFYSVSDNGPGIAPEHRERVFELYHRLHPRESEGEGLGLAIVKAIAQKHGGGVRLESSTGGGASFTFDFPAATEGRTHAHR